MLPLTSANPELDRQIRQTPAGMMFWAGTCPDPKATCGACTYFGYEVPVRNSAGNAVTARKYPARCELYWKHTKRHGDTFSAATSACKYFAKKKQP